MIRTIISVAGLRVEGVTAGMEDLSTEFAARPWLLKCDTIWDAARERLVISIEHEGDDLRVQGGGVLDEVSDCVIACIHFSGERISFHVDAAIII